MAVEKMCKLSVVDPPPLFTFCSAPFAPLSATVSYRHLAANVFAFFHHEYLLNRLQDQEIPHHIRGQGLS